MKNVSGFFKLSFLGMMVLAAGQLYADDTTTTQPNGSAPRAVAPNEPMSAPSEQKHLTPAEDAKITSTANKLLKASKTLSKEKITVSTAQGVVSLQGTVDSDSQASSAVELVQSIRGVNDVDTSNLNVKDSQQPFTDMYITAKVKGLMIREKLFGHTNIAAMGISVETNNGIVYLTGHIKDQAQVKNLINLIQGVKGVTKVEYNVKKVTPVNTNDDAKDNVSSTTDTTTQTNNHTQPSSY